MVLVLASLALSLPLTPSVLATLIGAMRIGKANLALVHKLRIAGAGQSVARTVLETKTDFFPLPIPSMPAEIIGLVHPLARWHSGPNSLPLLPWITPIARSGSTVGVSAPPPT